MMVLSRPSPFSSKKLLIYFTTFQGLLFLVNSQNQQPVDSDSPSTSNLSLPSTSQQINHTHIHLHAAAHQSILNETATTSPPFVKKLNSIAVTNRVTHANVTEHSTRVQVNTTNSEDTFINTIVPTNAATLDRSYVVTTAPTPKTNKSVVSTPSSKVHTSSSSPTSNVLSANNSATTIPSLIIKPAPAGGSLSHGAAVALGVVSALLLILIFVFVYKYQRRFMHAIRFRRLQEVPMDDFADDGFPDAVYAEHTVPIHFRS